MTLSKDEARTLRIAAFAHDGCVAFCHSVPVVVADLKGKGYLEDFPEPFTYKITKAGREAFNITRAQDRTTEEP